MIQQQRELQQMQINKDNIPLTLRAMKNWVLWRYEARDGKQTKVPYQPNRKLAKSNMPETWCDFDTAVSVMSHYSGIGFCLSDDIVGIDLDHCISEGVITDAAKEILSAFSGAYTEISPSGEGIRIFCAGRIKKAGKGRGSDKWIEVYQHPSSRYLTVTGNAMNSADVTDQQAALDWLHEKYIKPIEQEKKTIQNSDNGGRLSDYEVIKRAGKAKNGQYFDALMSGRWDGLYPSQSEADGALCCMLAFWTGNDAAQIDRIFRSSGLIRDKWDEKHHSDGSTYGEMTIRSCFSDKTYSPREPSRPRQSSQEEKPQKPKPAKYAFDESVLNIEQFPHFNEIVTFISETGPKRQKALALAAVLSFAGTLVGRKVKTETGLRTNLYLCGIADSGWGKNHARQVISALMRDPQNGTSEMLSMKLGTGAGIVALMDKTPCKLFLHDEFGLFLKNVSTENAPKHWRDVAEVLNDMFSEANSVYHSTATKMDGAVIIENPNLSVYATSTPEEFYGALTKTMLNSGAIARFLFVPGDGSAKLRIDSDQCEGAIPDVIKNHVRAVIATQPELDRLLGMDIIEKARKIKFTPDARQAWDLFRIEMDNIMIKNAEGGFSSIYNRAGEHAAKIALIVSCYELHDEISLQAMQWAIRFVKNAINGLVDALHANMSENLHEQQAKRILEIIRKLGGEATKSDITRRTKWCQKHIRDSILDDLVESGELLFLESDSIGTHKPTNIYRLAA
jgi:hypothetical protein